MKPNTFVSWQKKSFRLFPPLPFFCRRINQLSTDRRGGEEEGKQKRNRVSAESSRARGRGNCSDRHSFNKVRVSATFSFPSFFVWGEGGERQRRDDKNETEKKVVAQVSSQQEHVCGHHCACILPFPSSSSFPFCFFLSPCFVSDISKRRVVVTTFFFPTTSRVLRLILLSHVLREAAKRADGWMSVSCAN